MRDSMLACAGMGGDLQLQGLDHRLVGQIVGGGAQAAGHQAECFLSGAPGRNTHCHTTGALPDAAATLHDLGIGIGTIHIISQLIRVNKIHAGVLVLLGMPAMRGHAQFVHAPAQKGRMQ